MKILSDMLIPGAVAVELSVTNKKSLFQHFGMIAEREYGLSATDIVDRLTERERLGSTGFGNAVAIPHGKIDGLDHIVALFVRLAQPIDFQSLDQMPVDLVFCLLSPPDAGADHLKALAQVSRWLRDPLFVAKLRGAATNDAVFALLNGTEARNAA
jgi:PTS system nitrogen regulatory IIA component